MNFNVYIHIHQHCNTNVRPRDIAYKSRSILDITTPLWWHSIITPPHNTDTICPISAFMLDTK